MPEPIIQQVDATKNDCEKAALKRLLSNISREHPHLKLVLSFNFEHNYGHGEQHLATNLACLTFTAFLINQIEQLACKFFQQALEAKKSKKALWLGIRGLFDWFVIDNWEDVYTVIIGDRSVSLKYRVVDTT